MAANFEMLKQISGSSLHLKLTGDFDGSSAHKLINLLKTKKARFSRIIIHTSGLKKVFPFGKEVFKSQNGFKRDELVGIIFTGEAALDLALEGSAVARSPG